MPTPIGGGVKAYGRSGPVSYGILNVQTLGSLPHDDTSDEEPTAPENFTVARVRMQTGKYASFGILGVGKHRIGESDHEVLSGGIDGEKCGALAVRHPHPAKSRGMPDNKPRVTGAPRALRHVLLSGRP